MTADTFRAEHIHRVGYVPPATRAALWEMYRAAFADVDGYAVQRHLMTRDEFDHVATDNRIDKHVAYGADGGAVGQAVITDELDAWPLISPRYFERRWPDHYRNRRIFYVGYVCTTPAAPITTFRDLIADMGAQVFDCGGIAVMDFCTANVARRLPQATTATLRRLDPRTTGGQIDEQEFWAWRFDGQPLGGAE